MEDNIFNEIPEWSSGKGDNVPLYRMFKETGSGWGSLREPYLFTESRRRELEQGVGMEIIIPADFEFSEEKFAEALEKVRNIQGPSIYGPDTEGLIPVTERIEGEVDVKQVTGTMETKGWKGLARDFSVEEQTEYCKKLLASGPYRLRSVMQEDEVDLFEVPSEGKKTLCVGSGQHRVMAAKILAEMGCKVKLSNVKVRVLGA